jgi:hypothetical protein
LTTRTRAETSFVTVTVTDAVAVVEHALLGRPHADPDGDADGDERSRRGPGQTVRTRTETPFVTVAVTVARNQKPVFYVVRSVVYGSTTGP